MAVDAFPPALRVWRKKWIISMKSPAEGMRNATYALLEPR
jgi:hypothetical protein